MKCSWCKQKIKGSYAVKQRTFGVYKTKVFTSDIGAIEHKTPYYRRKKYYHKRCMDTIKDQKIITKALKSFYLPHIKEQLKTPKIFEGFFSKK